MADQAKRIAENENTTNPIVESYFNGVNASILHVFSNVKMTNEVSSILVQSLSEFAAIFADTASSVRDEMLQTVVNNPSPGDMAALGRSQQQLMQTTMDRCVQLSNRNMQLGQDMLTKISNAATEASSKSNSSS